ncbi:uncharacterized protein LOC129882012 isoform X2 [Solanum dulcamara]|uniref:uncharacterized protein LOC129882012 isoform X1 n=2 Tax=Solanum dulcamara TaxID=45834 RepID=UPI0024865B78|nr:uncharacterized protein LOC129882012 isoform X1 [Solanum dulcamara]XP_055812092.1 uncharacterized protein LOC129882012 isoform X2 [Solanum dulcamara]
MMNQNSAYRSGFASLGVWFDESETRDDHASISGVLCFDEKRVLKGMERKGALYNIGSSTASKRENEINQVLDLKRSQFEAGKIQAQNDLSTPCEDYLLDIEFAESITNLDYGSSRGLLDPILESQIPLSSCDGTDTCGMPYSSGLVVQEAQSQNAMFGLTNSELHDLSRDKCESQILVEYSAVKFPTAFNPGDISNVDDVAGFFAEAASSEKMNDSMIDHSALTSNGISFMSNSMHNEGQVVNRESFDMHESSVISPPVTSQAIRIDTPVTQKRLRKPTRRYIDESSDLNARRSKKRAEVSTSAPESKNKLLKVRCQKKSHSESMEMELFPEESSYKAIQVPFASLVNEECDKRHASNAIQVLKPHKEEPYKEATVVSPKDDAVAPKKLDQDGARRKHHRLWTVSEVRKLIDGVAQYGVGRWSHIKKLYFSSSVHRTPVDLKDKWRNLLKATYLQKQSKITEKGKHNLSWRPLPKSVLHRVSELANMHPYPRNRRCKSSRSPCASSSSEHTNSSNIQ